MSRSPSPMFVSWYALFLVVTSLVAAFALSPLPASAQSLVAGQNVNMVGGAWSYDPLTGKIVGDPFLQRQNEPSLAVSSRNPCHLIGGANDYRAVDIPGLPADKELGDAWLGLFKSIDCGRSWISTLLPGYPQDRSAEGQASPLKGLQAAADATVRSGPGGMVYYSGIAFNRGTNDVGKVFVARFLDHNNKEKGDPIRYIGTVQIDLGTSGQFLDKPWIAVDKPRGTATCNVDGDTVPAASVYLVYTSFVGGTNNPHSKIMFSKSSNCGATWSNPTKLSESFSLNQGTVMAVSPVDGSINVAWRGFADPSLDPNSPTTVHSILFARSTDGGKSFSKALAIDANVLPFDQGTSGVSFRTNAYPAMAIDGVGRIYVGWAARGFAAARPDVITGDARIVVSTSGDGGATWTSPTIVVDEHGQAGHQVMPALAIAAGKLMLVYYDFRADISQVFGRYVNEAEAAQAAGLRHTVELRAAMADPASQPIFTRQASVDDAGQPSAQVTRYLQGNYTRDGQRLTGVPLQFNPPNLPMFALGTLPFIGDYLDVASQTFVLNEAGQWTFNTDADPSGRRQPVFHATWSDNRDVRRPPAGQTWANYKSPTLGPSGVICDPGSNPGSRNQNIYTAPLMPGLVVTSPGNQKTLGQIQRAFVIYARNTTDTDRYYQLTIAPTPAGSWGSFVRINESQLPSPTVTTQIGPIRIPRRSSISRTVFLVSAGQAYPAISVQVAEVVSAGQTPAIAAVLLNPDIANPDIANPDIANPDIANPDIANAEVYNPDIANPDISNPDIANPDISNPDIANPDIANPDIANKTVANPDIANPDISNPDIANPDIANPDIANPDISNPDIANSAIGNFNVTDVTWAVNNKGNTTAAYAFRARLARSLPPGAKLQLIVRRVYIAPQASLLNDCAPPEPAIQNQVLVNIPNPVLNADLLASFDPQTFADNASFFLAPSDQGRVTLRLFCPKGESGCPATADDARSLAAARIEAQAPNNCPPGSSFANCQVNGFRPDAIYDVTPPTTSCTVMVDGVSHDCASGPFYSKNPVTVTLAPSDTVGVQQTTCTLDGQACAGLSFPVSGEGSHTVAFQSSDFANNLEALQSIVVNIDTTAPIVTVPAPITAEATSGAGAVVSFAASATDLVDGAITPVCVPGSGSTFPLGTTSVTCSATDAHGNVGSALFTITVRDTTAPLVTLNGSSAMSIPLGSAFVDPGATAVDSVAGALPVTVTGSVVTSAVGSYTLTYSATDPSGYAGRATRTVTVVDSTPPTVTISATPTTIWSPNGKNVAVTVSGTALDAESGIGSARFAVVDEYRLVQPSGTITVGAGGSYSFVVQLQASRLGSDTNGRSYTITVTATNGAGLSTSSSLVIVAVDHNR